MKITNTTYADGIYIAKGKSREAIERFFEDIEDMKDRIRDFQHMYFGTSSLRGDRHYGDAPEIRWGDRGEFVGFCFKFAGWDYDEDGNDLEDHPVPKGWIPVGGYYRGTYRPDPAKLPAVARACESFHYVDISGVPEICGTREVIQVERSHVSWPRAYHGWPRIYCDGDLYFISMPRDHTGYRFQPEGAEPATEDEWAAFRIQSDHRDPDFYSRHEQGALLPRNYEGIPMKPEEDPQHYFVLRGRSLAAYRAYEREKEEIEKKIRWHVHTLWGAYNHKVKKGQLAYACFEDPPYRAGWRLCKKQGRHKDRYAFDDTAAGRELREEFEELPAQLNPYDLHGYLYPHARRAMAPRVEGMLIDGCGHEIVITYDQRQAAPPPDAIEMPHAVYNWLCDDTEDERDNRNLPAIPDEALETLERFRLLLKQKPPGPLPRGPKPPSP